MKIKTPLALFMGSLLIAFGGTTAYLYKETCGKPWIFGYEQVNCSSENLASVQKNGKWGFIDNSGKVVIDVQYDEVKDFHEGFAGVKKDGKWGFIDKTGQVIIDFKYDEVTDFNQGLMAVRTNKYWSFIDKTGQVTYNLLPYKEETFWENLAVAYEPKTKKYGIVDKQGKIIVPFQYEDAEPFADGLVKVQLTYQNISPYDNNIKDYKKFGIIDRFGKMVIATKYDEINDVFDGVMIVKSDSKYGFIDKSKPITSLEYSYVENFSNGLALVKKNNSHHITRKEYGFIDKTGKEVIPARYYQVNYFYNGTTIVKDYAGYKLIDTENNIIYSLPYKNIISYKDGRAIIKHEENKYGIIDKKEEKYSIIDKNGHVLNDLPYSELYKIKENIFVVRYEDKYGIIDIKGNIILPIEYKKIHFYSKKYKIHQVDWIRYHYEYFLKQNPIIIEAINYDDFNHNDKSNIDLDKKFILIDEIGEFTLLDNYHDIYILKNDFIIVKKDKKTGIINKKNQIILPIEYDYIPILHTNNNLMEIRKNWKSGVMNNMGQIILPVEYDYISINNDNLINASKDGKTMYFDKYGNPTTP